MGSFVEFKDVCKTYKSGEIKVEALKNASFHIEQGEICIIVGQSGAGKTTLLNMLGGMDNVTSGEVILDGEVISGYNKKQLAKYRRQQVGFVFQFYNLIPNLTALENVELATQISDDPMDAEDIIELVGLIKRCDNFPSQLSGGEQQRVSIARAIAKNPKLLLCDEPTGALDYETGKSVLKLLQDCSIKQGMTVVIITHNMALTAMADRVIRVKNGCIESVEENDNPIPVENIEW